MRGAGKKAAAGPARAGKERKRRKGKPSALLWEARLQKWGEPTVLGEAVGGHLLLPGNPGARRMTREASRELGRMLVRARRTIPCRYGADVGRTTAGARGARAGRRIGTAQTEAGHAPCRQRLKEGETVGRCMGGSVAEMGSRRFSGGCWRALRPGKPGRGAQDPRPGAGTWQDARPARADNPREERFARACPPPG